MHTSFLLLTFLFLAAVAQDEGYLPSLEGMQSLSLICNTEQKRDVVLRYVGIPGFDFLSIRGESIDVFVTADQAHRFKDVLEKNHIGYRILSENMKKEIADEFAAQQRARNERFLSNRFRSDGGAFTFNYFPNYEETENYVKELEQTHGDVVTLIDIGRSYEGRTLYVVKISSDRTVDKPGILIDAGIHAREWIAPSTALYFIDQLARNQSNRYLLDKVDFYIVPVLNPDGYQFTHTDITHRMWRKTRSVSTASKCRGVDANRNFELGWMVIGASDNPCSDTYAGPEPFSEPEAQRLRDFVLKHNGTFNLYLTLHSYGQYLLYPWGYTYDVPADESRLRSVAQSVAKVIHSVRGTRYTYGSSANVLYPAAGGSDDWMKGVAGIELSYTVELPGKSPNGFIMPPSEIKIVGHETFQALKFFTKYIELTSTSWVWSR